MRRAVPLSLAIAAAFPAAAHAQDPVDPAESPAATAAAKTTTTTAKKAPATTTTTTPTETTTTPVDPAAPPAQEPAPTPAGGTLTVTLERVGGSERVVFAGSRVRVRGSVSQYVAGQRVAVRLYSGTRKLAVRSVAVLPAGNGRGMFVTGFTAARSGRLTVRASHRATPEQQTMVAKAQGFTVIARYAAPGSRGLGVRLLQQRLAALGYVVGARGTYDSRTARAVLAFRRMSRMAQTQVATAEVFRRLDAGGGTFTVRYPSHGRHVEADLSHQVLALIDGGRVQRLYPISSGKPSTPTVLGSFRFYMKTPGTNAKGMVYSNYFIRGYAIHGYASVPNYPASHGCLRVPVPDAVPIYNWVRYGDRIDVYYR